MSYVGMTLEKVGVGVGACSLCVYCFASSLIFIPFSHFVALASVACYCIFLSLTNISPYHLTNDYVMENIE